MKRVLFVDDEKNVLDGMRRMLRASRESWEMEFVSSGEAALLACNERAFDVVVSDLRMPGMDGAQLLGHIRDQFPSTARIILSGYSELALTARAVPVAYRVLAKPCNGAELKETIERVCTLQDILCSPMLRQIIGSIGELPSLSSTYIALSHALRTTDTPISDVAKIIEQDVAMSAKILQLVNSGFFGLARRATFATTWSTQSVILASTRSKTWRCIQRRSGSSFPIPAYQPRFGQPCSIMRNALPSSPAHSL